MPAQKRGRGRPRLDANDVSGRVGLSLPCKELDGYCRQALRHDVSVGEVIRAELLKAKRATPRNGNGASSWSAAIDEALPLELAAHPTLHEKLARALRVYAWRYAPRSPWPTNNQQEARIRRVITAHRAAHDEIAEMQVWLGEFGLGISPLTQTKRLDQERAKTESVIAYFEKWLDLIQEFRAAARESGGVTPAAPRRGLRPDRYRARLAHMVFAALEDVGLALSSTRGGYLADVIRIMYAEADRIDCRRPRARRDLYRQLHALLKTYRAKPFRVI